MSVSNRYICVRHYMIKLNTLPVAKAMCENITYICLEIKTTYTQPINIACSFFAFQVHNFPLSSVQVYVLSIIKIYIFQITVTLTKTISTNVNRKSGRQTIAFQYKVTIRSGSAYIGSPPSSPVKCVCVIINRCFVLVITDLRASLITKNHYNGSTRQQPKQRDGLHQILSHRHQCIVLGEFNVSLCTYWCACCEIKLISRCVSYSRI